MELEQDSMHGVKFSRRTDQVTGETMSISSGARCKSTGLILLGPMPSGSEMVSRRQKIYGCAPLFFEVMPSIREGTKRKN